MANGFDLSLEGILANGELDDAEVVNAQGAVVMDGTDGSHVYKEAIKNNRFEKNGFSHERSCTSNDSTKTEGEELYHLQALVNLPLSIATANVAHRTPRSLSLGNRECREGR